MHTPLIELKNIHKGYEVGDIYSEVLRGISLSLYNGDFLAIMGPSGSGKSTLLHICGLLDYPSSGEVFFKGKRVSSYSEDELATIRNKNIGFVFQRYYLIPYLSVVQNVILPFLIAGGEKEEGEEKAKKILDMLDLSDKYDHVPNAISGGEQQRVAIARSLINDPEIIIADEPTGNLDSKRGEEVMNIFTKLNKKGITILLVTHDKDIAGYAKNIKNIKDGVFI